MADAATRGCVVPACDVSIGYLADHPAATARVASWLHREWPVEWGGSIRQVERALRARMQRDRLPLCLLAFSAGRPVGTASLVEDWRPDVPASICTLAGLFVLPRWRRRGIGSRLCERAVEEAVRMRQPELAVFTPDREAFYAGRGWRKLTNATVHSGIGLRQVAYLSRALPAVNVPSA